MADPLKLSVQQRNESTTPGSSKADTISESLSGIIESTKPEQGERGNHQDNGEGQAAALSDIQKTVLTLTLCACVFLAALDATIITTALPTIAEHFQSIAGYTWVGAAYTLAEAASQPTWGKLSDIWGRKPLLQIAVAVFFVGSLISAISINIGMLIAGRAIQGIGGGGSLSLVNIVIGDLFAIRDRGKYYGFVGMTWAIASSVGPVVGGAFTEKVSWRWCFYINLPITGTVFIILYILLKLDTPQTPLWAGLKAVDWLGSLAVVGATVMFLLGLEFGGVTHPWKSAIILCLIIFGIVCGAIFILVEWKIAKSPIMPLRVFNSISNSASMLLCFLHGLVYVVGTFYMPLYFQGVLGATALLSGVWFLPSAGAISFGAAATGVYIKKTGKYLEPIWVGFIMMTIGFGLFINLDVTANWGKIVAFQIIAGLGIGPNFQALMIALQNGCSVHDIATATATFGFVRNVATSVGVVIGGVIFQNGIQNHASTLRASLGLTADALLGGAATASTGLVDNLPPDQRAVARKVYHDSITNIWIFGTAVSAVGILACLLVQHKTLSTEHQVIRTGLEAERERDRLFAEQKRAEKEAKSRLKDKERNEDHA